MKFKFKVSYETVGSVQMIFLRLLSEEASQNFTYTCMNSVAWFDSQNEHFDSSLKFLGDNEVEIGYESSLVKPNILVDGCKVNFKVKFLTY